MFDIVMDVARGNRGRPPQTVVFLSGDVHNSYVAEVTDAVARHGAVSTIAQAVCSPIRNPMPIALRVMVAGLAKSLVRPMNAWARGSKHVPDPAYPWEVTGGPWFDNCFAELCVDGTDLSIVWRGGQVRSSASSPSSASSTDEPSTSLTTVGTARIVGGRG
ncbi:MAG: hypothetical protein ABI692_00825 [Terracoccus sp.]